MRRLRYCNFDQIVIFWNGTFVFLYIHLRKAKFMNTMKRYLLGIIGLLSLITLQAQDYSFKYYFTIINGHDGLSQTDIKAMCTRIAKALCGLDTRNKLNRFDGNSIQVFDCYDSVANKRNNNISSLYEDKNKHLWIGTDKGIFDFQSGL